MKRWLQLGKFALWAALLMSIALSGLVAWIELGEALAQGETYRDFTCYYVGARVLEERPAGLYEAQTLLEVGRRLGLRPFPYLYPPLFAWLLRPLSHLPYTDAVVFWTVLNAGLFAALLLVAFLFLRELAGLRWALPALLLAPPLVVTLFLGQVNVLLLLFLLPVMRSSTGVGRWGEILRGLGIALAAHLKPVWGLLLLFELFRKRRYSVGTAILFTLLLWGLDLLLVGPEVTLAFFRFLPEGEHFMRLSLTGLDGSLWGATAALLGAAGTPWPPGWPEPAGGFFRALITAPPLLSTLIPVLASLVLLWCSREELSTAEGGWDSTGLLGVVVVTMVSPHLRHDAALLFLPALLVLARRWGWLRSWQRWALWGACATTLPSPLWLRLFREIWPLALTAVPLFAGRLLLWMVLRSSFAAGPTEAGTGDTASRETAR